jgi:tetratricopeptide (TPR) repeat protein
MLGGDATSEQMRLLDASQSAMKEKLYEEALTAYEKAKETLERLASKSTSVPKYRRAVAQAYVRIGDLHLVNQQDQKALAAYQSAADVLTPMVAEFPAYQQLLDEANGAIAQTKQYIKEAAAAEESSSAEAR